MHYTRSILEKCGILYAYNTKPRLNYTIKNKLNIYRKSVYMHESANDVIDFIQNQLTR